jgi:NADPH-dependent 2,4-dienoyl-CoA reductase/sulfur reductase-like enzyme
MSRERLVVIGGDAAGMTAASQARRLRPDADAEYPLDITVLERSPHTSYSA